jgi:RNA recognition motif-containing protein
MKVFIGNLPSRGTPDELSRLLQSYGYGNGIEFNVWKKREGNLAYFAVVDAESEHTAGKLISNLSNTRFLDSRLEVRTFHKRHSYHNERRDLNWRDQVWQGEERRIGERRQGCVRLFAGDE